MHSPHELNVSIQPLHPVFQYWRDLFSFTFGLTLVLVCSFLFYFSISSPLLSLHTTPPFTPTLQLRLRHVGLWATSRKLCIYRSEGRQNKKRRGRKRKIQDHPDNPERKELTNKERNHNHNQLHPTDYFDTEETMTAQRQDRGEYQN